MEEEGALEPERLFHASARLRAAATPSFPDTPLDPVSRQPLPAHTNPLFRHSPLRLSFESPASSISGTPANSAISTPHLSPRSPHSGSAPSTPSHHQVQHLAEDFPQQFSAIRVPYFYNMAHLYPFGGSDASTASHHGSGSMPPPQFGSGDTQAALRFATSLRHFLAQSMKKEKLLGSQLEPVLSAAAPTFPTGTAAARWFADVSGRGTGIEDPTRPRGTAIFSIMYLAELGLRMHHALTPIVTPEQVSRYCSELC